MVVLRTIEPTTPSTPGGVLGEEDGEALELGCTCFELTCIDVVAMRGRTQVTKSIFQPIVAILVKEIMLDAICLARSY